MSAKIFWLSLRREYWEYRFWLLAMPLLLSLVLTVMVSVAGVFDFGMALGDDANEPVSNDVTILDFGSQAAPLSDDSATSPTKNPSISQELGDNTIEVSADDDTYSHILLIFIGLGWIVAFFYSLSSLHSDRKDTSILFWKSLPVNDTIAVLSKMTFAAFVFPLAALVVGWLFCFLITILCWLAGWQGIVHAPTSGYEFFHSLVYPPIALITGVLRSLPLLALVFLASAFAKRSPLMVFAVPIVGAILLELLFFKGASLLQVFAWYLPFNMLEFDPTFDLLQYLWPQNWFNPLMLVCGWVVAGLATYGAIWLRKYRFEI
jgi:ABC-2 type transport system permease protein